METSWNKTLKIQIVINNEDLERLQNILEMEGWELSYHIEEEAEFIRDIIICDCGNPIIRGINPEYCANCNGEII